MLKIVSRALKLRKRADRERGEIDIGGTLVMGIGMVFLAVGFIMYPIVISATDSLLAYSYSACASYNASFFTGFVAIAGITPLLVLVGYLSASVFAMYLGVRIAKGVASATFDLGRILLLGLSLVFIAIGLIIMPVAMDAISPIVGQRATVSDVESYSTGVGVTVGNVTLTQTIYCNDFAAQVISISSNETETPVADNYTDPRLYLTALTANETRTLTTTYYYADNLASYTGLYTLLRITPLLLLIAFLSGAVITGFFGLKKITEN